MFKRRKPDDPHVAERDVTPPTIAPPPGPRQPGEAGTGEPAAPDSTQRKPAEISAGVPPFRPAPPKEASPMARTPFAPTTPSITPTLTPTIPPQPTPGQSPLSIRPPGLGGQPASRAAPSDRRTLVVGRGISVQGTVQDAERLIVEGTVEATMIQATELSISQGGVFKGEAQVDEAEIAGTIDGTLTARGSLVVRGSGRVLGTARCKRLQVEDGGQITGRIEMVTEGAGPSSSGAPRGEPTRMTPETVG